MSFKDDRVLINSSYVHISRMCHLTMSIKKINIYMYIQKEEEGKKKKKCQDIRHKAMNRFKVIPYQFFFSHIYYQQMD